MKEELRKLREGWVVERENIAKMSSIRIISTFEQLIRNGAGGYSIPLLWYRDEILNRCVKCKEGENE